MSHTIMTIVPFLLLALSPFVMSDSDYVPGGGTLFLGRMPLASALASASSSA